MTDLRGRDVFRFGQRLVLDACLGSALKAKRTIISFRRGQALESLCCACMIRLYIVIRAIILTL
jgi:hypothetical protein